MEKFTVKDLKLSYRPSVTGVSISRYPDSGLIYSTPPMDNTYTKYANLQVSGLAYNYGEVDYEDLMENPEDTVYEEEELVNISFKFIDLKQLGEPIGFTKDKLGCSELLERGFKLDLYHLFEAMDCESGDQVAMYNAMMSIISNTDIKTPITVYSKEEEDSLATPKYTGYIKQDIWDFRNPIIAFVEDIHIKEGFENRGILSQVFKDLRTIFARSHNYDLVMLIGDTTILDGRKFSNVNSDYAKKFLVNTYDGDADDNSKGTLYFNLYGDTDTWVLSSKEENTTEQFETIHFVVTYGDDINFDCDCDCDLNENSQSACSGKCEDCKGCCVTGSRAEIYRDSYDVEFIGTDYEDYVDENSCDCENCNKHFNE